MKQHSVYVAAGKWQILDAILISYFLLSTYIELYLMIQYETIDWEA